MILFWNTLVCLFYGALLNPDNVFVVRIKSMLVTIFYYGDQNNPLYKIFEATSGGLTFVNMIGSGLYGVIAIWLLVYPLAGYLADVRFGRYKVVKCCLCAKWSEIIAAIVIGIVFNAILWPTAFVGIDYLTTSMVIAFIVVSCIIIIVTFLALSVGLAAFAANVVQFGIDQLQDFPARDSFLFIHWYLFTYFIGVGTGKLVWSACITTAFISLGMFGLVLVLFLFAIPVTLCISKRSWFVVDTGLGNPYKEVAKVVKFAREHKIPIHRSAFTYWEDDIPTGLDLGKDKYGGPFTTEQVENVKAFFGILYILLSLGLFFTADIAASAFLPILQQHVYNDSVTFGVILDWRYRNINLYEVVKIVLYSTLLNGGTLYPIFIVLLIPVYLKIIHPLFQRYTPGSLKRIGIGLCLICLSLICSLVMDLIGHLLKGYHNSTSVFDPGHFENRTVVYPGGFNDTSTVFVDAPSLELSPYALIIQNILVAIAYVLIYGGVFEFICAQSPHSTKGFLVGLFFAVKGFFQLIGVLCILLPFSFLKKFPQAGLIYFLVNIMISVIGIVAFSIVAKRYQYRQREDVYNGRKYVEE